MNAPATLAQLLPPVRRPSTAERAEAAALIAEGEPGSPRACHPQALAVRDALAAMPRYMGERELIVIEAAVMRWIYGDPNLAGYADNAADMAGHVLAADSALHDDRDADL